MAQEVGLLHELSGWLLPCGRFLPTQEWWHVAALYDLKDMQYELFSTANAQQIFAKGDEEEIRNFASSIGFIKISRAQIDGERMNAQQLQTLKNLLTLMNPESELEVLSPKVGFVKVISVQRVFKLKNSSLFFTMK